MENNKWLHWALKIAIDKFCLIIALLLVGSFSKNSIKRNIKELFTNERREAINKNFTNHNITIQCIFQIVSKIADNK